MIRLQSVILAAAMILVATAAPAHAVGVITAIGALIKGNIFLSAIAKLAVSVALSRLAQSLAPKPKQPGIKTEGTASGSQNPASFIIGLYATNGVAVCPPMSHGTVGKTPNAYLTYVIELSDVPGVALNALIINGERCTLGGTPHADYGLPVTGGTYGGHAWIRFYDGTQTVADPMLLDRYGSYPQRPWISSMIGNGIAYAIVTFRYNRKVYTSFPEVRFELLGIPMYDPRKDSTVGGSGAHRWNNPATWERTNNPIVMVYNIHRGISLPGGYVWGGGMPAGDIPLASVFAAANACDALVNDGAGGTEPRFRAGYEVFVSDEPAAVCEDLLKSCLGQAADVGGFWRFQAGDPDLPVYLMTDEDLLVSLSRERQPFPSIEATNNGISASFPNPAVQWEPSEARPIYNATWEAADGRRRVVNVDFNAVPYPAQVQRNMRAMIKDDRRFLTHGVPLPPEATVLEPLDTLSWTSAGYGYSEKTFEIVSTQENLRSGVVQLTLRERDPTDTAVPPDYLEEIDTPSTIPVIPAAQAVPGFAVVGISITDATDAARRPALQLTWDAADLDGIQGLEYEVRRTGSAVVIAKANTSDIAAGELVVSEGLLAATDYEVRAILLSDRDTSWTAWTAATTPNTLITSPDIAVGAVSDQWQAVVLGPLTRDDTPNASVITGSLLNIGEVPPGSIYRLGFHFDVRVPVAGNTYEVVLQRRYKQFGSDWTTYEDRGNFIETGAGAGVWVQRDIAGSLTGSFDEVMYRVVCRTRPAGGAGTYQWLRNIYLTLARITK